MTVTQSQRDWNSPVVVLEQPCRRAVAVAVDSETLEVTLGLEVTPGAAEWKLLRARPKAERVFAEYENFLKLSDPTDRPTDRP